MIKRMPILKKHIALCKCHRKILRSDNKESLDIILKHNVTCDYCSSVLEYKGEYLMEAENIVDESFKEEKVDVIPKQKQVRSSGGKREKLTKELAIQKNIINEDGTPYRKNGKDPNNGAMINAIKFAVMEENITLLNKIFLEYNDLIKNNVARYIGKKEKEYIKQYLNVEL